MVNGAYIPDGEGEWRWMIQHCCLEGGLVIIPLRTNPMVTCHGTWHRGESMHLLRREGRLVEA